MPVNALRLLAVLLLRALLLRVFPHPPSSSRPIGRVARLSIPARTHRRPAGLDPAPALLWGLAVAPRYRPPQHAA